MDAQVKKAQMWVNATYAGVAGYTPCAEDGITGWNTMYALTRALQRELGISPLSDAFGPTTMAKVSAMGGVSASTPNTNIRIIVEAALYCKGYLGGAQDGAWLNPTRSGLGKMMTDMGFAVSGFPDSISPKQLKSLLTMDAYVLTPGGSADARAVQQWMNATYIGRSDFYVVPCDGFYSRGVQKALVYALQYSLGMADGTANGSFGPATQDGLRSKGQVTTSSTDSGQTRFVKLFKAALTFNGYSCGFSDSGFTSDTVIAARRFQRFSLLSTTGSGDYQTWASLIVSTGDPTRQGKAADCRTPLNSARAAALKANGYETVGRYLTGSTDKALTSAEIQIILQAGLSFYPIYQTSGNVITYFSSTGGATAAKAALAAAKSFNIPRGTVIYFAVDFDATDPDIDSNILPHFMAIDSTFEADGRSYAVGIYGSRNVCRRVSNAGYATRSFVSSMSTGFSGNLGFGLPGNWAFDQIATKTIASGQAGQLEIDNNIKSGRDIGVRSLSGNDGGLAAYIDYLKWLESCAREWYGQGHKARPEQSLVSGYVRTMSKDYMDARYNLYFGSTDTDFASFVNAYPDYRSCPPLRDPKTLIDTGVEHWGASYDGLVKNKLSANRTEVTLGDFSTWAGDLITALVDFVNAGKADEEAATFAKSAIGNRFSGQFMADDMAADVDAHNAYVAIKADPSRSLSSIIQASYGQANPSRRFWDFFYNRFIDQDILLQASRAVFFQDSDQEFTASRNALFTAKSQTLIGNVNNTVKEAFAQAFTNYVMKLQAS